MMDARLNDSLSDVCTFLAFNIPPGWLVTMEATSNRFKIRVFAPDMAEHLLDCEDGPDVLRRIINYAREQYGWPLIEE